MKQTLRRCLFAALLSLLFTISLLPATALAAGEDAPDTLYVGNQSVRNGDNTTYWVTNGSGGLESSDANANWNVKYDPAIATLTLNGATITGNSEYASASKGTGIYALSRSGQPVSLTVKLIGENTITGTYGIYVNSELSGDSYGIDASLTITGESNGSLKVSGSYHGIYVKSGTGDASLKINDASVVASSSFSYSGYAGVYVQSSTHATSSPQLSLKVNGGSLTASGGDGISFNVGSSGDIGATTSLTVSNNAIVRAENGIKAYRVDEPTPSGTGIVFNDKKGTVYGDVTLDESLTINQGEALTIPNGSKLDCNNNLTNNGTIVNEGGTLNGEPGGTIVTVSAPAITTESLPDGATGQSYTATLEATGNNITWRASNLPAGLTLDADTGAITGIPTTDGQFQVTVTATNSVGSIDRAYTLNIKPATVSVTGLKLDKDSLILQENGSHTLTATVEPADATNKAVTWASSDTNIATVSEDGTVTAISTGNVTITATAADGSGISASCNLTVTHGNMIQTPKKDATCTVDGTEEYWTCEICGKHYKDESGTIPTTPEENKIPAINHSYGEPEWSWSEDGKTATATFTCQNDESHKETREVTVTSAVKTPATCTETGVTAYTATVGFGGQTYTDTKDVADIPATGHKLTKTEAKAATCTEPGNTEYWTCSVCGKVFSDDAGEHQIAPDDTVVPATGHSWGEDGHCAACDAVDPDFAPAIIAGADATWQKGSGKDLAFTSSAAYGDFQKVQVDGKDVDAASYTVEEGSTVVTLKASYLETLSAGKHALGIVSETGVAETEFTITAAKEQKTASGNEKSLSQTGDDSMLPVAAPIVLAAASIAAGLLILKRSRP